MDTHKRRAIYDITLQVREEQTGLLTRFSRMRNACTVVIVNAQKNGPLRPENSSSNRRKKTAKWKRHLIRVLWGGGEEIVFYRFGFACMVSFFGGVGLQNK